MSKEQKQNNGQFPKGTSGNPSGRPRGSRNRATLLMEALLEGEAEELTRKVIELGKAGDTHALRLCLERLMPPGRDRLVHFDLPPLHSPGNFSEAILSIFRAVSEGQITPQEGETVSRVLASHATLVQLQELDERLSKLEQPALPEETTVTPIEDDPLC